MDDHIEVASVVDVQAAVPAVVAGEPTMPGKSIVRVSDDTRPEVDRTVRPVQVKLPPHAPEGRNTFEPLQDPLRPKRLFSHAVHTCDGARRWVFVRWETGRR